MQQNYEKADKHKSESSDFRMNQFRRPQKIKEAEEQRAWLPRVT